MLVSDSFSESESLSYETREDTTADILNVVNWPETEGRDFRFKSQLIFVLSIWLYGHSFKNNKKENILKCTKNVLLKNRNYAL